MTQLTFKPKQVGKRLLSALSSRAREVITKRFGLGTNSEKMTLEAIGKTYKITRERVRQIENHALVQIRKSDAYKKEKVAFDDLTVIIKTLGGVVSEDSLLKKLAKDTSSQNYVHFILVVGEAFSKYKEDEEFRHSWHIDGNLISTVHNALRKFYSSIYDKSRRINEKRI